MPMISDVKGMVETQQKLEQTIADLRGSEFLQGMRDATLMVSHSAKELAPVDLGRLRASITPEIRQEGSTVLGVVGSRVKYAAAAELGSKPHTPPFSAIQAWARRKGIESAAGAIWQSIRQHGTQGHFFFQNAFEQNKDAIVRKLGDIVGRIVQK
jgi:hypothetical protein